MLRLNYSVIRLKEPQAGHAHWSRQLRQWREPAVRLSGLTAWACDEKNLASALVSGRPSGGVPSHGSTICPRVFAERRQRLGFLSRSLGRGHLVWGSAPGARLYDPGLHRSLAQALRPRGADTRRRIHAISLGRAVGSVRRSRAVLARKLFDPTNDDRWVRSRLRGGRDRRSSSDRSGAASTADCRQRPKHLQLQKSACLHDPGGLHLLRRGTCLDVLTS